MLDVGQTAVYQLSHPPCWISVSLTLPPYSYSPYLPIFTHPASLFSFTLPPYSFSPCLPIFTHPASLFSLTLPPYFYSPCLHVIPHLVSMSLLTLPYMPSLPHSHHSPFLCVLYYSPYLPKLPKLTLPILNYPPNLTLQTHAGKPCCLKLACLIIFIYIVSMLPAPSCLIRLHLTM